ENALDEAESVLAGVREAARMVEQPGVYEGVRIRLTPRSQYEQGKLCCVEEFVSSNTDERLLTLWNEQQMSYSLSLLTVRADLTAGTDKKKPPNVVPLPSREEYFQQITTAATQGWTRP